LIDESNNRDLLTLPPPLRKQLLTDNPELANEIETKIRKFKEYKRGFSHARSIEMVNK